MAAIFYSDENQLKLASESRALEEKRRNKKIQTAILPLEKFYLAENYHQKYQLRQYRQLLADFKAMYSRDIDFINSTAAARVNGYVGGHGSREEMQLNIESLGLSAASRKRLLEIFNNYNN